MTIVVEVVNLTYDESLIAKLFVADNYGASIVFSLNGTISLDGRTIIFMCLSSTTANLTEKRYYYEIIIYKADKSYIKTVTYGILYIVSVIKVDPTT